MNSTPRIDRSTGCARSSQRAQQLGKRAGKRKEKVGARWIEASRREERRRGDYVESPEDQLRRWPVWAANFAVRQPSRQASIKIASAERILGSGAAKRPRNPRPKFSRIPLRYSSPVMSIAAGASPPSQRGESTTVTLENTAHFKRQICSLNGFQARAEEKAHWGPPRTHKT